MVKNLLFNKILWLLTTFVTLFAATVGTLFPDIYSKVISQDLLPAVYATDVFTIVSSLFLLFLLASLRKNQPKKEVVILGILGFFFYNYGILVIERVYNSLYLVYLAIFTFSFWSILFSVFNIDKTILSKIFLSKVTTVFSSIISFIQPLIFIPLWTIQLLPLMREGKKIENLYSIFILDLCFIMPAFLVITLLMIRKKGLGLLLAPVIFILGFFEIFSLSVSELAKPFFNQSANMSEFWKSTILSLVFLVMAIIHLKKLKIATK